MSNDMLSDVVGAALAKALDGNAARHKVLAENIANVDTPGYRRRDVTFHGSLKSALETIRGSETSMKQLERVRPQKYIDRTRSARLDGNSVNIETEMSELAKNTMEYETNIQLLSAKLRLLRLAISGR